MVRITFGEQVRGVGLCVVAVERGCGCGCRKLLARNLVREAAAGPARLQLGSGILTCPAPASSVSPSPVPLPSGGRKGVMGSPRVGGDSSLVTTDTIYEEFCCEMHYFCHLSLVN